MGPKETGFEVMDWNNVTQDRDNQRGGSFFKDEKY
jgi:hypothetical protein